MDSPVTVCAFSMSANGNSLGQWRAYCPVGGGYALGIFSDELVRLLRTDERDSPWKLVRCRYEKADQEQLLEELVDWAVHELSDAPVNFHQSLWSRFLVYAAQIKHPDFSEEQEWRLISSKLAIGTLSTRATNLSLIPYREIKFDNDRSWIARLVVGPHTNVDLAFLGADNLLRRHGIPDSVFRSPTPYHVVY